MRVKPTDPSSTDETAPAANESTDPHQENGTNAPPSVPPPPSDKADAEINGAPLPQLADENHDPFENEPEPAVAATEPESDIGCGAQPEPKTQATGEDLERIEKTNHHLAAAKHADQDGSIGRQENAGPFCVGYATRPSGRESERRRSSASHAPHGRSRRPQSARNAQPSGRRQYSRLARRQWPRHDRSQGSDDRAGPAIDRPVMQSDGGSRWGTSST